MKKIVKKYTPIGIMILSALLALTGYSVVFAQPGTPRQNHGGGEMTLSDCIRTAVEENRTIRSAYLDRIVQKYDLRVAEDKFYPKVLVTPGVQYSGTAANAGNAKNTTADISATVIEKLPTGATINLTAKHDFKSATDADTTRNDGWNASLNQPLLKGGGWDVATASVRKAIIGEQNNVLSLKTIIMDTVTSVITAYRGYVQAIKALEISRQSLERGKELVAVNRELIAAGRMAKIDIVQSEADVAGREFNLLAAENGVDAARLALVKILDIDKSTRIIPMHDFTVEPIPYTLEQATKLALTNRPDYQSSLLGLELTRINLALAKNSTLWDLSLTAGYDQDYARNGLPETDDTTDNWNVGLRLSIPFRDLSINQGHLSARINLVKTEMSLARQRENIEIEVQDALRNVEMNLRQVGLARLSRELSEKKYEIESEKLKVGRSTNFQLVSFQNDLVSAQNNELNSIITYLNALTTLERSLGITLDIWGVSISERDGE